MNSSSKPVDQSKSTSTSARKSAAAAPPANHGSLSSIVSHLVRSSWGESAASTSAVKDSDLDRHVANLLLQEAKEKQVQWSKESSRAYLPQQEDKNAPIRKPNKRFLSNMIRNVDDHNQALKRQEEEALRKREREERQAAEDWRNSQRVSNREENLERAGRQRGRDSRDDSTRYSSDYKRKGRQVDENFKRSERDGEEIASPRRREEREKLSRDSEGNRRRRSRSPASRHDDDRHHHSTYTSHKSRHRRRSESVDSQGEEIRKERKRKKYKEQDSPDRVGAETSDKASSAAAGSKMDKYFEPSYDPRFDVSVPDLTESNGLIAPGAFETWDDVLVQLKERKAEKKFEKELRRQEREKIRRRRRGEEIDEEDKEKDNLATSKGMMEMKYTKSGTTREWDLGKLNAT